ncbi:MAG TPA: saccharopine dehydrogenase NADP-binding domain-containing protein [Chitinophagaceae bacterium]|nr:saccharopine dehydrogenase NADP-binding domain-containing protein [Chitinophagaceae bacterium]
MLTTTFLLYGANGYSGELIARYASQYNLHPILAGRRKEAIEPLAAKYGLPYRIFDVNDTTTLLTALKEVNVVMNAAGPFDQTAKQIVEACLQTGTHYLDINGDISVFELIKRFDEAAKKAGILLLPGAGFDVVPTDCLAMHLKNKMPDAVSLKLAFATLGGSLSHGTATTMANKLGEGGAARRNGKIVHEPLGQRGMWVDFGQKKLFVMSIPWGDISTAHFTTGIPDIECYTGISRKVFYFLKLQRFFNWALRTDFIRKKLKARINRLPAGPTDAQRDRATGFVWGEVTNAAGEKITARLTGPEGYTITVHASLIIIRKVLNGDFKAGYGTPAGVWGEGLIYEIPGVIKPLHH